MESFEECARCGTYVARTPFEEWPLMKRSARATLVFGSLGRSTLMGLAPGVVAVAIALASGRRSDMQLALGLVVLGLALAVGAWALWLGRLLGGSRRRMGDPWYQAKLAQFAIQSNRRERFTGPPIDPSTPSRAT